MARPPPMWSAAELGGADEAGTRSQFSILKAFLRIEGEPHTPRLSTNAFQLHTPVYIMSVSFHTQFELAGGDTMKSRRSFWKTVIAVIATVVLCGAASAIELEISIKPDAGSTNTINPNNRGVTPVAILGSEIFDVGEVNVDSLTFGPGRATPAHGPGGHLGDVNGDGLLDLTSHYVTRELGLTFATTEACVTGESVAGERLSGCDAVLVVPSCGLGYELALLLPPLFWLYGRRNRRI